jgi:hypothetical protein
MRAFFPRKLIVTLLAASTLTAGLASSAEAKFPIKFFPPIHHHHGFGPGAAGFIGGLAVGAIAASAADAGECYLVNKRFVDEDGNIYIREATVCE